MKKTPDSPQRRIWLTRVTCAGSLAAAGLALSAPARASKVSKEDFFYQESPKDGHRCGTCKLFSEKGNGHGECMAVDGVISANGWCMAWSSKN